MFKLSVAQNGFVHACGHRGHSIGSPENTLAALHATLEHGGTSAEIDVVLTKDDQIVLMHDLTVDRTTSGHGLVASHTLEELQALEAGAWFAPEFSGTRVPTLEEALAWSRGKLGLVVEIKEFQRVPRLIEVLGEVLERTDTYDQAIFISFDHRVLYNLKQDLPKARTETITHERFVDPVAVMQAAHVDSVSIELEMFNPEDAQAIHDAGIAIRLHLPRPKELEHYKQLGIDWESSVGPWLEEGLVDTLSGDDVEFLAELIRRYPLRHG
jgi:glycerophosphoryl diester phosphodiesterase